MKVLVVHSLYRDRGGEERHIDLLTIALRERGHEVWRHDAQANLDTALRRLALGATLAYRPGGGRAVSRLARAHRPDIIHFHNITPALTPSALRAAKRCGATVVLTLHNFRFACPAGTLLRNGRRHDDCLDGSSFLCGVRGARAHRLESVAYGAAIAVQRRFRLLERWVDAIVVPAAHLGDAYVRAGGSAEKLHVVPYGVPLDAPADGSGRSVLYAGRLSEEKGVRTLLAAAREVSDLEFVVAGGGPLAHLFTSAPSNVRIVGHLSEDGVATLRRASALSVVPSEWSDILPFAALNSLAAGLPVVGTPLGGLTEIVEPDINGVLVPERDPIALAAELRALIGDAARLRRLQRGARASAERRFELGRQTDELIAVYQRALEGR